MLSPELCPGIVLENSNWDRQNPAREYANNYALQKTAGPVQCSNSLPGTFLFGSIDVTCVSNNLFQKYYVTKLQSLS